MSASKTLEFAKQLVAKPSITPNDAGCQEIIATVLEKLNFAIRHMPFGFVSNLWASHGHGAPHLVFLGHTDVVPPGELSLWKFDPFTPTIIDGKFYGRGIADMKGGVAAMLSALEDFITTNPNHKGTISVLITSDEEGPAIDGVQKVAAQLQSEGVKFDWCIVGEPGSQNALGDTLKLGARGSLTGSIVFTGKQGHVGHPHKAKNPIHAALNSLHNLTTIRFDEATPQFPASSLQITNIHSGVGAENVIPETMYCQFNIRFAPYTSSQSLKESVTATLNKQALPYTIEWRLGAEPFVSEPGLLTQACTTVVDEVLGYKPTLTNAGGTTDARFIVKYGCEAVEIGLLNTTIHAINENVAVADLDHLTTIYLKVLQKLMV